MATFPPESQTSKKAGHDILFYSSFNSFYIRLRRRMTKGESFSFAFAPGTDEAMGKVTSKIIMIFFLTLSVLATLLSALDLF